MKTPNHWIAVLLLGIAGLIAGIALAVSSDSHTSRVARVASRVPSSRATYVSAARTRTSSSRTVSSVLVKHYAVLRRARVASDAPLPAERQQRIAASSMGQRFGVVPSQARAITLPGGQLDWFIPGTSGGCLVDSEGVGCASSQVLASKGLIGTRAGSNSDGETLSGLVPDGVSLSAVKADGSTVMVPVTDNAFELSTSLTDQFVKLEMRDSSGNGSDISIPPLPSNLPSGPPANAAKVGPQPTSVP